MLLRWIYVATAVVVTSTVINCEASSQIQHDITKEDLCPCLPASICPRVFGTKPEDAKYLGDIMKCNDNSMVRCCGASSSFVVGMRNVNTTATTQATQPDILSRLNPDDFHENEIPYAENESDEFTTALSTDDITEAPASEETQNIGNFHNKYLNNDDIDEEPAGSESITETINTEFGHGGKSSDDIDGTTKVEESSTVIVTTEKQRISHRKPKNLDDDVIKVYPNIMSGVPKTTPKNLPETNEMNYFDQDAGMDLHLVFSNSVQTTVTPEVSVATTESNNDVAASSTVSSTNKPPRFQFAKRRRQYRPIEKRTTEAPQEEMELLPATISDTVTRPSNKVRPSNLRRRPQHSTDIVTKSPRVKLTSRTPITQEEEILHTSEDDKAEDKTHENRFRLFNARHRLNYLQRTTTTTESPTETPTRHMSQSKPLDNRRPSRVNETSTSKPLVNRRPSKMNETLIRHTDANHRNMISKVRVALKAATTENRIVEIPRSFASVDIDRQIRKMEKVLESKMVSVYTEVKSKRRGVRPITVEPSAMAEKKPKVSITERPNLKSTTNSTRPYRGNKKFQFSDLLEKTVMVAMNHNEVKRMRIRTPTVRPVDAATDGDINITPTTYRPRRRPPTTIQPLNSEQKFNEDSRPAKKQERNYGRRNTIRRKFTDEPILTTTVKTPEQARNEITMGFPTISAITTLTTTTAPITTMYPTTTHSLITIKESQNESEVIDNSTEHIAIKEIVTLPTPTSNVKSATLSDFRPSPLWSIQSGDQTDFFGMEESNRSDDDRVVNGNNRRSRNAFEPPKKLTYGFIPVLQ